MVVNLPKNFPAVHLLKDEPIVCQCLSSTASRLFPSIKLAVLNLMPLKIETEADLLRLFATVPFEVEISWLKLRTHTPKHTPKEHMDSYYTYVDEVKDGSFDALVVTGAPVELMPFEEVTYWKELEDIFAWAHTNIPSTLYICWAAQAALFYQYGINKFALAQKMFGVFAHQLINREVPLFRGFDDVFYAPHSRHTSLDMEDLLACPEIDILSSSAEAGAYIMMSKDARSLFVTGHSEYAPLTLDAEYRRDKAKGLPIAIPMNYYRDDNPNNSPVVRWRAHANLLFTNWLNYYVYQQIQK